MKPVCDHPARSCCIARPPLQLHAAAGAGQEEAVRLLLSAGASTAVKDVTGASPLIHAARCRHVPIIVALLEASPGYYLHYRHNNMLMRICYHA